MAEEIDFGPGSYGDYSGVEFLGPPTNGFWLTRFGVSDVYLVPLLTARLAAKWDSLRQSWEDAGKTVEVSREDISEIAQALSEITAADLAAVCDEAGCSVHQCLLCAASLSKFLKDRLQNNEPIFVDVI